MTNSEKYVSLVKKDLKSGEELIKWADAQWLEKGKASLAHSGVIAITSQRFMWRGKREWTTKESLFDIPIKQIKGFFLESTTLSRKLTLLDSIDQRRTFTSADAAELLQAYNSAAGSESEAVNPKSANDSGLAAELTKLGELKASGLLSNEEFEAAKRKLLGL